MNRLTALDGDVAEDSGPRKKKPGGKKKAGGKRARAAAAAAAADFSDAEELPPRAAAYAVPEPSAVPTATAAAAAAAPATAVVNIEPQETVPEVNLDEFSRQTREVQTMTSLISDKVLEYSQATRDKLKLSDAKKRKEMSAKIDDISKQIDDNIKSATALLEKMKSDTDIMDRDLVGIVKMRENQHNYLLRQFIDSVKNFSKVQQEGQDMMQEETERRVRQRLNAQGERASDEDVRKIATQVMQGQENALFSAAKDELAMVQQNARDMQKIYDAMVGLEQLFRDFDTLVNEQGEVLDQISSNLDKTEKFVAKGMKNLNDAKKYQKKASKSMCKLLFVVALIGLLILAVIMGFAIPT